MIRLPTHERVDDEVVQWMGLVRRTAGIWGPLAFCAAAAVAAHQQPGYSHRSHHVSGLAARGQRSARWMIPGFVALGTSDLLVPAPDPSLARLARIAGATTIAAGLVQVSAPRCPQPGFDPAATASDVGHALASDATFGMWTALPILAGRADGPTWYRLSSRVLAGAAVVGVGVAGATTRAESRHKGLAQRAFLGAVFAWHLATAIVVPPTPNGANGHGYL